MSSQSVVLSILHRLLPCGVCRLVCPAPSFYLATPKGWGGLLCGKDRAVGSICVCGSPKCLRHPTGGGGLPAPPYTASRKVWL